MNEHRNAWAALCLLFSSAACASDVDGVVVEVEDERAFGISWEEYRDKAIVEATEGDPEKAVDMFEKVAETLAKKMDDGFDEVIDELQLLTDALGLDVEMPREND